MSRTASPSETRPDRVQGPGRRMGSAALGAWPAVLVWAVLLIAGNSLWAAFLAYHAGCLLAPLPASGRLLLQPGAWRRWLPRTMTAAVPLAVLNLGVAWGLGRWNALRPSGLGALVRIEPWPAFCAYVLLLNPALEERYWRAVLQPRIGLVATSVWFAAAHVPMYSLFLGLWLGSLFCVFPFLLGLYWGTLTRRHGTLWPAALSHLAVNVALVLAATGARG